MSWFQEKAIELNNHGVSQWKAGALWESWETFQLSLSRLDAAAVDENENCCTGTNNVRRPAGCCACRLDYHSTGISGHDTREMESHIFLNQGNPCLVTGYEWEDCTPATGVQAASVAAAANLAAIMQSSPPTSALTTSKIVLSKSHESWFSFLSFASIKIKMNHHDFSRHQRTNDTTNPDDPPKRSVCDCSIRWAILHNLGVLSHTLGISLGERGYNLLDHAKKCYMLAQSIIPASTNFEDILRLIISGENNQMLLHYEFGRRTEFLTCLERLMRLLHTTIPELQSSGFLVDYDTFVDASLELGAPPGISTNHHRHHAILLNLMILVRTEVAPAA